MERGGVHTVDSRRWLLHHVHHDRVIGRNDWSPGAAWRRLVDVEQVGLEDAAADRGLVVGLLRLGLDGCLHPALGDVRGHPALGDVRIIYQMMNNLLVHHFYFIWLYCFKHQLYISLNCHKYMEKRSTNQNIRTKNQEYYDNNKNKLLDQSKQHYYNNRAEILKYS